MSQSQIPPGMLLRVIRSKHDIIAYYGALARLVYERQAAGLLAGVRADETAHLNMFNTLYIDLYGETPPDYESAQPVIGSLAEGIRAAALLELEEYARYGNIILSDSSENVRRTFTRALLDENRHASVFTLLLAQGL